MKRRPEKKKSIVNALSIKYDNSQMMFRNTLHNDTNKIKVNFQEKAFKSVKFRSLHAYPYV